MERERYSQKEKMEKAERGRVAVAEMESGDSVKDEGPDEGKRVAIDR